MDISLEERQHAGDMMKYINKRGGCVVLDDIPVRFQTVPSDS